MNPTTQRAIVNNNTPGDPNSTTDAQDLIDLKTDILALNAETKKFGYKALGTSLATGVIAYFGGPLPNNTILSDGTVTLTGTADRYIYLKSDNTVAFAATVAVGAYPMIKVPYSGGAWQTPVDIRTEVAGSLMGTALNPSVDGSISLTATPSEATLGTDKVSNGDFSLGTIWTLGTNWSIGSGVATKVGTNASNLEQNVSVTAGKSYKVTFTMASTSDSSSFFLQPYIGGAGGPSIYQRNATYTITIVLVAVNTGNLLFYAYGWAGTIDNVIVKEITISTALEVLKNSDGTPGVELRSGGVNTGVSLSNTFMGAGAGQHCTVFNTGNPGNTGIGKMSLYGLCDGYGNVGLGYSSLRHTTSGSANVGVGPSAGFSNMTGTMNVNVGSNAGFASIIGNYNVAIGASSLQNSVTGVGNTGIGTGSLYTSLYGDYNTAVGFQAMQSTSTYSNSTALGANAAVTGSNQVQLGDASTTTYAYGAVQNRSDARWKDNITDLSHGLDLINALRPRAYKFKDFTTPAVTRTEDVDGVPTEVEVSPARSYAYHRTHYGLIAQEVKATLDDLSIDCGLFQDHSLHGGEDVQTLGYTELIAPLIKAVQELSARVLILESRG